VTKIFAPGCSAVPHESPAPWFPSSWRRPSGPHLGAIMQSFQVDQAVVRREAGQIAAPAIGSRDCADSCHWSGRSAEFQNYQLGYSVVSSTQGNAHGTLWNDDAAALVEVESGPV